ncbi:MAG: hypothetical protein RDV48_11515 [Candidatus Eremiobacteraeota bacterium]|nr:hypothetical protein [Candidatus Eremiobacteraeota bacterium]
MDNTIPVTRTYTPPQSSPAPAKPSGDEAKESPPGVDMAKLAQPILGVGNNLKAGEKVTISMDGDKVIISKEGPDGWDKFKQVSADATRAVFRTGRALVEQDPSFAFRESLEISKNSVERMLPEEIRPVLGAGLYPVVRTVLTAIDVHKAIKTKRDGAATTADKLVDYGHIATDVAGLLAIASPIVARTPLPGASYFAVAAVIGDIIAGAWHALRFAGQGLSKLSLDKEDKPAGQNNGGDQKPPAEKPDAQAPKEVKAAGAPVALKMEEPGRRDYSI